jgi:hypothetical protein
MGPDFLIDRRPKDSPPRYYFVTQDRHEMGVIFTNSIGRQAHPPKIQARRNSARVGGGAPYRRFKPLLHAGRAVPWGRLGLIFLLEGWL